MIDLENEKLITLREVPKLLPPRPSGRRLHISAVYRWVYRGVRGVRLESIRIGGMLYTTREALDRFSKQLSSGLEPPTPVMTQAQELRELEVAAVQKRLEERLKIRKPDAGL